jgi:hypothetical protein
MRSGQSAKDMPLGALETMAIDLSLVARNHLQMNLYGLNLIWRAMLSGEVASVRRRRLPVWAPFDQNQ